MFGAVQIQYLLLVSRQGKVRLTKWYAAVTLKEKNQIMREVSAMVLNRAPKMCNFIEWKEKKIVYKRCAGGGGGVGVRFVPACVRVFVCLCVWHRRVCLRRRLGAGRASCSHAMMRWYALQWSGGLHLCAGDGEERGRQLHVCGMMVSWCTPQEAITPARRARARACARMRVCI